MFFVNKTYPRKEIKMNTSLQRELIHAVLFRNILKRISTRGNNLSIPIAIVQGFELSTYKDFIEHFANQWRDIHSLIFNENFVSSCWSLYEWVALQAHYCVGFFAANFCLSLVSAPVLQSFFLKWNANNGMRGFLFCLNVVG